MSPMTRNKKVQHIIEAVIFVMSELFLTVSGPTTFVGGGMDRKDFRSSGPGDFRDNRLRGPVVETPILPNGLAAKSSPFIVKTVMKRNQIHHTGI